jgi:di/tricarboxylate transporter
MPVGFATIIGGTSTTIGTSTNLLVVSVANDLGLERIEMFDFFVPAAIAGGVAILYLWLIAPLLLPIRKVKLNDSSPRIFQARLVIDEKSPAVGLTLAQTKALLSDEIRFVRVRRGDTYLLPLPDVVLQAGDRLRVRDTVSNIRNAEEVLKAALYTGGALVDENNPLKAENQSVAEIAVVAGSNLAGGTLRDTRFLDEHQLLVIALHRAGKDVWSAHEEIMDVVLEPGDVLLVQGEKSNILKMKMNMDFMVLDASEEVAGTAKAPIVMATLVAVVAASSFGFVPIAISSMVGVFVLLATRSIRLKVARRAINPSVVLVVVASLAIGQALQITGASDYLAEMFLYFFQNSSPTVVLSALMFMMAVLTNIVSNNAAAVIGTPIAIGIAQQLGAPPESFVLAVLFGANLSFVTPMSYNTNLLVMSAGNYTFNDFVRVGLPLTVIMWISYTLILSNLYL